MTSLNSISASSAVTSEEIEALAVSILAKELAYWRDNDLPFSDFNDDVALEILVEKGIRPSRLGCDLEWLIHRAYRKAGGASWN